MDRQIHDALASHAFEVSKSVGLDVTGLIIVDRRDGTWKVVVIGAFEGKEATVALEGDPADMQRWSVTVEPK